MTRDGPLDEIFRVVDLRRPYRFGLEKKRRDRNGSRERSRETVVVLFRDDDDSSENPPSVVSLWTRRSEQG